MCEASDCSAAVVLQENLEALFYQYGVNVIFTGHVHAYERCLTLSSLVSDQKRRMLHVRTS